MAECIFQKLAVIIRPIPGNLPGGPVAPLNQEEQVQSLVRALRSHMLQDQKQNKTPFHMLIYQDLESYHSSVKT